MRVWLVSLPIWLALERTIDTYSESVHDAAEYPPLALKLGRMVRYRNTDIDAYLRANTRGRVA